MKKITQRQSYQGFKHYGTLGTTQNQTTGRHHIVGFTAQEGKENRVVTNLTDMVAAKIIGMYKSRWAIDFFFFFWWIKQKLKVPALFGTSKNALLN